MVNLRDIRRRIGLAVHVLRGRPLAYRLEFVGKDMQIQPDTTIAECKFTTAPQTDDRDLWARHSRRPWLDPDARYPAQTGGGHNIEIRGNYWTTGITDSGHSDPADQ